MLVDTLGSHLYTDARAAHLAAFFKGSMLGKRLFYQVAENMGYHTKIEKEVAKNILQGMSIVCTVETSFPVPMVFIQVIQNSHRFALCVPTFFVFACLF